MTCCALATAGSNASASAIIGKLNDAQILFMTSSS
jgi:hypothetical protein